MLTMYCMCYQKGSGLPFDLGASNGAHVRSVGFGFWPVRTHDSDCARRWGRGISYGNQHSVETGENHEKKMFWSFKKIWKKCGMLRGWCFIATQNFKLKHITRCELWKRQNQRWIVLNSNVTIQGWICLFHSSHLVMFFNLKFCVAIKHDLLNIPHFFRFFWNFKIWFPRSFHWILVLYDILPKEKRSNRPIHSILPPFHKLVRPLFPGIGISIRIQCYNFCSRRNRSRWLNLWSNLDLGKCGCTTLWNGESIKHAFHCIQNT